MAVYNQDFLVGVRDVDSALCLTNKALLGMFEDVGALHSDSIGCGVANIEDTGLSWVILHWKVKVYRRPKYGEKIGINTWVAGMKKLYIYRQYEVLDEKGEVVAVANSQWVLTEMAKGVVKIPKWVTDGYGIYERTVFDTYPMSKLKAPEDKTPLETRFKVGCSRIDFNGHMNNLQFLDVAADAISLDKFKKIEKDDFQIMYKKQSLYGENLRCKYYPEEKIFAIKDEDDKHLHAILEFR